MRINPVKRKLLSGGTALGTMAFEFANPALPRLAELAGAEFVLFDMEHTGWSIETIRALTAAARPTSVVPLARVPATQYHFLARVLDVGVLGVMVPMVESEEQARQIVQFTKYPPLGRRGSAFGMAHDDYGGGDPLMTIRGANEEGLVIAQIETSAGVQNVERIAATAGIDVLWVGQFDLTSSLGITGQFNHPHYLQALERVLAACKQHGKAAGFMALSVEEGKRMLQQGFRCLAYSGDSQLYRDALGQGIKALRATLGGTP